MTGRIVSPKPWEIGNDEPYDFSGYEHWRDTVHPNYKVSDFGRVMHWKKRHVLKQGKDPKGYKRVSLAGKNYFVHRLVALAFIPNPLGKPEVNHKDGDKANNKKINLEWVTGDENRRHAERYGLAPKGVRGKRVRNWKTGKEYNSIREAARDTGRDEDKIRDCLHGRRPSAGWEFINKA